MATPFYGQAMIKTASGKSAYRICYASDAAGNLTWDSGAGTPGASSPDYLQFGELWTIVDMSLQTAATMKSIRLIVNGVQTMVTLSCAVHLNTNPYRPPLSLTFGPTERVSWLQA